MVTGDFKERVLPFSKKLLRIAVHFLKDNDEAKDVVQDVFLKLWQKKEELDRIENMEAFSIQMTRNRCLDLLRTKKMIPIDAGIDGKLKQANGDIHAQIEWSEAACQVKKLIEQLPDLQQKVMQLRDIEQLEYEEIAERTGLQINTIRVNLSRARKKVRDEFLKLNSNGNERGKTVAATLF